MKNMNNKKANLKSGRQNKLSALIQTLSDLEASVEQGQFNDEENLEEFLEELTSASVSLESAIEIMERDSELENMNDALDKGEALE